MRAAGTAALLLALAFALGGCAVAAAHDHSKLRAQLQQELDGIRERAKVPGITAAILLGDGSLLSLASGEADTVLKTPMPVGAVMPTGSIGKQFVSAVALSLEHDRRVDMDVTIDRWFKDDPWFKHVPNAHALTLRMLLMHRGGVGDHRQSAGFRDEIMAKFAQRPYDPDFRIPPEKLISFILDTPPLSAPNAEFHYSETGYILAGMALERACGCVYYDELERRFLQPLRLEHTRPANVRSVPGLVQGLIGDSIPGFPPQTMRDGAMIFSPATEWTGGGLFGNVDDLVRWSDALYSGRAMNWPYLDELIRGDPALPPAAEWYGLGTRTMTTRLGVVYGHAGEFPGYRSLVSYFPDHHAAVALQINVAQTSADLFNDGVLALMKIALATESKVH